MREPEQERDEEIRRRYREGRSVSDVAELVGCSVGVVFTVLCGDDLVYRMKQNAVNAELRSVSRERAAETAQETHGRRG